MKRIRRLLITTGRPRSLVAPAISAGILLLAAAAALTVWQARAQEKQVARQPPEADVQVCETRDNSIVCHSVPRPYIQWLNEDVAYIVTDDERKAFRRLETNDERDKFIEQFWQRRNPVPAAAENPFRGEHYRRIQYANDHFAEAVPGWKTDRGRIYIEFGPPDERDDHPNGDASRQYPWERWQYRFIQGIGSNVFMEFVDPDRTGEFHMTMDPNPSPAQIRVNRPPVSPR